LVLANLVFVSAALLAQPASPSRLVFVTDSLVTHELAAGPTAGVAVAIMQGRALTYARGYGLADVERRVPVRVETVFRLGSVTKQFTAAAVLQLVEQGKLRLDDEITKYLPDAPVQGRRVTIHQLLNHTSGIKNYTSLGPETSDLFRLDLSPTRLLAMVASHPPDFEPGTSWLYNNTGFYLLGLLIEKISGESYPHYLAHHIFEPLGLRNLTYCDDRAVVPFRAHGYDRRRDGGFVNAAPMSMAVPYSAGSLCGTVLDLVRWRRALTDGRVVSAASYQKMIEPAVLANGWRTNYAYGLARYRLGGELEVIRHGGTINGFQANLLYLPKADLIVAVLANTSGSDPVGLGDQIAAAAVGLQLAEPMDQPLTAAAAARYVGDYQLGPFRLEVRWNNGRLVAGPPGFPLPARLVWQGGDRFLARPVYAFGFYGAEATVRFTGGEGGGTASTLTLNHPLGGTIAGRRISDTVR
jgi:CubicO group peptidase (beta-lactamase class C family)